MSKKILSAILLVCMLVNSMPVAAFAQETQPACNHRHNTKCGYRVAMDAVPCNMGCRIPEGGTEVVHAEGCSHRPAISDSECSHKHDETCSTAKKDEQPVVCGCTSHCSADAVNTAYPVCGAAGADLTKCIGQTTAAPSCDCDVLCAGDAVKAVCPVCGAEGADLSKCIGKAPETEAPAVVTVSAWTWVDTEEIYNKERKVAELAGVGPWEDVKSLLPAAIRLADGTVVAVTWTCDAFAAASGTYTLTATLPEGYALEDGSNTLSLKLEMGVDSGVYDTHNCSIAGNTTPLQLNPGNDTLTGGDYYLSGNLDECNTIYITGTVKLCLNGHTLKMAGSIEISDNGNLTLCDCTGNGAIDGSSSVKIHSGRTLTMVSGKLSETGVTCEGTFNLGGSANIERSQSSSA